MSDNALRQSLQTGLRHGEQFVVRLMVGMTVTAEVELIAVDGKSLRFRVRCMDEAGLIGEGTHERAIVDFDRLSKRVAEKGEKFHV